LIDNGQGGVLERLLRNHAEQKVVGAEIEQRDQIDAWLAFLSTLELALISGFVPAEGTVAYLSRFNRVLSDARVRRYYEVNYPLLLPVSLRKRLEGVHSTRFAGRWKIMLLFLSLEEKRRSDPALTLFLRLLDGFRSQDIRLSSVIKLCRTPRRLAKIISDEVLNAEPPAPIILGLRGLERFFVFCLELRALIQATDDEPVLQSALWHFHAYWFSRFRDKLGARLAGVLNSLRASVAAGYPEDLVVAYERQLDEYEAAIAELAGLAEPAERSYAAPLREILGMATRSITVSR
jgi:hypothetical protein